MLVNAKCTVNVESYISDKAFVFYLSQRHTCRWKLKKKTIVRLNPLLFVFVLRISYQWWIVHWTLIDLGSNFMEVLFQHVASPSNSVGKERFPSFEQT